MIRECPIHVPHKTEPDTYARSLNTMDDRYVDALKALADPNRLRVYYLLVQIDERICVAEAMDVLGESHYNVSRNLRILLKAGLVTAKKEGKWVFYTLRKNESPFFENLLATVRSIPIDEFSQEIESCKKRLSMRKDGHCIYGPDSEEWKSAHLD
jgi:ArsR family transcriptional regulator